jgi:hypothetical protein
VNKHKHSPLQLAVWLTIAGEDEDFWLSAGESVTVPAHRLVVIEADQQNSSVASVAAIHNKRQQKMQIPVPMAKTDAKNQPRFCLINVAIVSA